MAKPKRNIGETPLKSSLRILATELALPFDGGPAVVLSDEERASYFMSQYNEIVDPFRRFPRYWELSGIDYEITLGQLRNSYKRYVLGSHGWTEDKFVAVAEQIFERELLFTQFSFDRMGKLYERRELDAQPRERRRDIERRRRDI